MEDEQKDPKMLAEAETWIARRGYILTLVLILIWPLLSIPAGKFTRPYFAFWVLLSIAWGFGAAIIIAVLPLVESDAELAAIFGNLFGCCGGSDDEAGLEGGDEEAGKEA